ncbi:MAG: hypothetical protein HOO96_25920 [Polyangiaceae bacterium]|nr:hypothetical protein [Polyangiaceae bacterium]
MVPISLACEFPCDNPALHDGPGWLVEEPTGLAVPVTEPRPEVAAEAALAAPVEENVGDTEGRESANREGETEGVWVHDADEEDLRIFDSIVEDLGSRPPEVRESCIMLSGSMTHPEAALDDIVIGELDPFEPEEVVALADAHVAASAEEAPEEHDPFRTLVAVLASVAERHGGPASSIVVTRLLEGDACPDAPQAVVDGGLVEAGEGTFREGFARQRRAWSAVLRGESDDLEACGGATLDEFATEVVSRALGHPERALEIRKEIRSRGIAAFGIIEAA